MAYASASDFISAFGEAEWLQLTDRDLDEISDTGVGSGALDVASGIIDGYVGAVYSVPLTVVDPVIRQITLDLSRWILSGNAASERVTEGYKEANRRLSDIASQRIVLTAAVLETASGAGLSYSTPREIFTRQPTYKY